MTETPDRAPVLQRVVEVFLRGNLSVLFIIVTMLIGAAALLVTPREEEPQIVVPIADILVRIPGASAEEVERQVATPLEKLLFQIDGVEYVYSMSRPGMAIVTVRFFVGEDREDALVRLHNKIQSNTDVVPPSVESWVVKPVEIDDVPIVNVALFSAIYDDAALRRMAEEVATSLQSIHDTNRVSIIGGRPRLIRVTLDATRLAARFLAPLDIARALQAGNVRLRAGNLESANIEIPVEAGDFLSDVMSVRELVVGVHDGRAVRLEEVATVSDAEEEVRSYTRIGFGPAADTAADGPDPKSFGAGALLPVVHVAVAKKKGSNAVRVARAVERRLEELKADLLPDGVFCRITRNYGETADDKVNELVEGLVVAMVIVIGLFVLTLGWREALVVAVAVPLTFAITLGVNHLLGYTINRVTLFALILVLGLVVDDPIVDVENIHRHLRMRRLPPFQAVLTAVNEVRPPIILTTIAVIVSFLPLFFITGMMGPYMRPMALNVPVAMTAGTFVALTVTPWLAWLALRGEHAGADEADDSDARPDPAPDPAGRGFRRMLSFFFASRAAAVSVIAFAALLFVWAGWLAMARKVPLKMLPYDNKNEFQILIDMPEGTTLETTDAVATALTDRLREVPEVSDFTTFAGLASAMDFNGLVRRTYLREGSNVADIRVSLADKDDRRHQSHEIVLRLRKELDAVARRFDANIKLLELPPGPPVVSTIVAEIYGAPDRSYSDLIDAARIVRARLEAEAGVADVDDTIESDQVRIVYVTDKDKAALAGVSTRDTADTLALALGGRRTGVLHRPSEAQALPIEVRLPRGERSDPVGLERIAVRGISGSLTPLSEIGRFERSPEDKTIYHKNLERVVFVFAEVAGRAPAEAILDIQFDREFGDGDGKPSDSGAVKEVSDRSYFRPGANLPWSLGREFTVRWTGEGEWKITLDAFRDLGIAFAAACLGIYVLLVWQTSSYLMPLILMISIPLTIIGIMPGFWLLNLITARPVGGFANPVFFTATAMIGMIALSGIAVRNAILLIEFTHLELRRGRSLADALIEACAVRFRPILLTAGSSMLAAWPITLDPVFSGLAWALIFGLFVSTLFSLVLVPVVYHLVYAGRPGHGLPPQ